MACLLQFYWDTEDNSAHYELISVDVILSGDFNFLTLDRTASAAKELNWNWIYLFIVAIIHGIQ